MKRTLKIFAVCLVAVLASGLTKGQGFITPLSSIQLNKETVITKTDGSQLKGVLKTATCVLGYVKKVTLKDEAGVKHKLTAADIKLLKVKPGKLAKVSMLADASEVPSKISKERYEEILNREWIVYEQTMKDKAKDVYVLGQLLNPGFDSKFKVYVDPNAKSSSIGGFKVSGPKSFLLVKKGNKKSTLVKKGEYKKLAKELFGDCSKMMKAYPKFDFNQIAEHVFYYDQNCK